MIAPLYSALSPLGARAGAAGIVYLLRDEFTTDASAPLASPRTCEPGGGTLTIVDTGNHASISGNKLSFGAGMGNFTRDPRVYGLGISRNAGIAVVGDLLVGTVNEHLFGWSDTSDGMSLSDCIFPRSSGSDVFNYDGSMLLGIFPRPPSTVVRYSVVLRAAGVFYLGKVSGVWTLGWVKNTGTTTPRYPTWMHWYYSSGARTLDNFIVADLGGSWSTDYGIATNRVASPTSPTATTSTANAIIEFTWTPGAGETLELDTRRTDADNRWIVRCAQAGSTIKLIERNLGSETERSSAAQTWSLGTAYRIVVIQDANTIKTYVANTAKNSYASASFNNTATGVNVAGFATGTNLVCYPRDVSQFIPAGL